MLLPENMNFEVLDKDKVIARVWVDYVTLPPQVRVEQYEEDFILRPFLPGEVTMEQVVDFFEERCFPRTRANAQELLECLGLKYYDPIAIVHKTHGCLQEDQMWLRFEGETYCYDDIKVRD